MSRKVFSVKCKTCNEYRSDAFSNPNIKVCRNCRLSKNGKVSVCAVCLQEKVCEVHHVLPAYLRKRVTVNAEKTILACKNCHAVITRTEMRRHKCGTSTVKNIIRDLVSIRGDIRFVLYGKRSCGLIWFYLFDTLEMNER